MRIGVLGTGDVGKALGNAFITLGHEVMMGSRSATNEKALAWAKSAGANAESTNVMGQNQRLPASSSGSGFSGSNGRASFNCRSNASGSEVGI